jgi:branched-subunit amino acid transport protein
LERAVGFVPVALLTALVVASLAGVPEGGWSRLVAAAGAAAVARWTGQMWACILSGMVIYWLVSWVGGDA